ncbi:hypothetical protein GCM10010339_80250 [Streptomyces alanosinicus]|uniref:Uncharacterized protein n=1 Tax=Streptomyces alanosinicus TaxID=68171 RepID=A0A919D7L3_9ACTN|nr:hypothetical protein GCM10010339_80250 [Streptomyces alanosinicus]
MRVSSGTAGGSADPDLLQHGDELRAVGSLSRGQDERQRAALPLTGNVDLARLPTPGASEQGGLQTELAPPLVPLRIGFGVLPALFFEAALFDLAFSSSEAASFLRPVTPPTMPQSDFALPGRPH